MQQQHLPFDINERAYSGIYQVLDFGLLKHELLLILVGNHPHHMVHNQYQVQIIQPDAAIQLQKHHLLSMLWICGRQRLPSQPTLIPTARVKQLQKKLKQNEVDQ